MKKIVQIPSSTKPLWITNACNVIVSGIDTAPIKRSAKATLDSRMFEFFFKSLLVFTAVNIITKRLSRMVTGKAMVVMATIILKELCDVSPR